MKRLLIISLLMLAPVSALAANFKGFESKATGLKAEYPAKWERIDNEAGFLVTFVPPAEKGKDPYANYTGFIVHPLNGDMATLEDYTALSVKEAKGDPKAKILETAPAQFAGQQGHRMTG